MFNFFKSFKCAGITKRSNISERNEIKGNTDFIQIKIQTFNKKFIDEMNHYYKNFEKTGIKSSMIFPYDNDKRIDKERIFFIYSPNPEKFQKLIKYHQNELSDLKIPKNIFDSILQIDKALSIFYDKTLNENIESECEKLYNVLKKVNSTIYEYNKQIELKNIQNLKAIKLEKQLFNYKNSGQFSAKNTK